MSHAYVTTEAGVREPCLYCGDREVSFDEERLFPFGEQLVSLPAGELAAPAIDRFAEVVIHHVREEQAALASTAALQDAINALLDRPRPTRALRVQDLRVLYTMHTGSRSAFPYLFETLEDELGFGVTCTADTVELTPPS